MTSDRPTNQGEIDLNVAIAQQQLGNRFDQDEQRGTRDPVTRRFIRHADYGADNELNIKFSTEPVFSKKETYLAGGIPKYVDMDFITISVPGNRDLLVHTPVTDFYQWRFPAEYEAFKRGKEAAVIGTPIDLWPAVTPSQVQELKHHGIRTVEQIANLSDGVSGVLRNFYSLKHRAQQYLEDAKDKNAPAVVRAELAEERARHEAELQLMRDQIAQLMEMAAGKEAGKKPKPTEPDR